ncbi:hypothetical protein CW304_03330 [Bacillus sp. UFRGS-B20]|nr:hypothetical protein CW304_03330 [Bacillus sp. UFRGS-B20]
MHIVSSFPNFSTFKLITSSHFHFCLLIMDHLHHETHLGVVNISVFQVERNPIRLKTLRTNFLFQFSIVSFDPYIKTAALDSSFVLFFYTL